ncbi:Phosphatidyl serine synthase [Trinorchestia longiramus]|nr:Phosphatidyl serine synthase [Trinorchestia longiramus]
MIESSPEHIGSSSRRHSRTYSSGSETSDHFISINERPVDDISIDFFYKPHTITLLLVTIMGLMYFCFKRDETASLQSNIQVGLEAAIFFFLIISVLAFPNGPFTRPHPAVWRCVFGLSVLYMLLLIFLLFQVCAQLYFSCQDGVVTQVKIFRVCGVQQACAVYLCGVQQACAVYLCGVQQAGAVYLCGVQQACAVYLCGVQQACAVYLCGVQQACAVYLCGVESLTRQDYQTVRGIFEWFFPELKNFTIDMDKGEWGENCDDFSLQRLWGSVDFFCFAHFAGWAMKTLLVRHYGILWTISIMWEITELCFCHLLPNFKECWWDSFILDVVLCNGAGIWFGMQFCHWMEMRYYSWESIKDIRSTSGKLKRAVLQFTPESWTAMRWLDPSNTVMRTLAVCQLIIFWQLSELNTFFLKHIFQMPPSHPIVFIRILLLGAISAPSLRQYYSYVTDPRIKRVGTQAWVYGLCMSVEALICFKFGSELFHQTQLQNVLLWLAIMMLGSALCIYLCVQHQKWSRKRRAPKERKSRSHMSASADSRSSKRSSPSVSPRKSVTLSTPDSEADRFFPDHDDEMEFEAKVKSERARKLSEREREWRGSVSSIMADDESDDISEGETLPLTLLRSRRSNKKLC